MEYVGNILYDEKLLSSDSEMIIFGCGMYGRKVLEYLKMNGAKDNIICFCDTNAALDGQEIDGVLIRHTTDVLKKYPNADYLVSGKYFKEMYQILRQEGIKRIHILMV